MKIKMSEEKALQQFGDLKPGTYFLDDVGDVVVKIHPNNDNNAIVLARKNEDTETPFLYNYGVTEAVIVIPPPILVVKA